MYKRFFALAMAVALLAALTGCGQSGTAVLTATQTADTQTTTAVQAEGDIAVPQDAQTAETQAADETPAEAQETDSKTGELFRKYVRDKVEDGKYTLRTEQSGVKITVAVDGDDSSIESNAAGVMRFSLVHKGDDHYMVMHSSKKYAKMTEAEYIKQVDSLDSATVALDRMEYQSSGTETLDGKEYSTETYDEGPQGVVTYFFDETGVQRTRVEKNGRSILTDVFTVTDDVDASAFEIPSDYKLVSNPAQLLG